MSDSSQESSNEGPQEKKRVPSSSNVEHRNEPMTSSDAVHGQRQNVDYEQRKRNATFEPVSPISQPPRHEKEKKKHVKKNKKAQDLNKKFQRRRDDDPEGGAGGGPKRIIAVKSPQVTIHFS